jgi:hypothetical protein
MGLSLSLSLLHQFCSFLLSTEFPHISQNFLISELPLPHFAESTVFNKYPLHDTKSTFTYYSSYSVLCLFFFCVFEIFLGLFLKINLLFFLLCWSQGTGLHSRRVQDYFLCPAKKNKRKKQNLKTTSLIIL